MMGGSEGKPVQSEESETQKQDDSSGEMVCTPPTSERGTVYHREEGTEEVIQNQPSLSLSVQFTSTQISTTQLLTRQQSVNAQAAVGCSLKDVRYEPTTETINFYLLARLLLDVCSDAMRDLLRCKISGGEGMLTKEIYQNRDKLNHLSISQKNIIMPPNNQLVQYDSLDFTLLYTIFRNVCPKKIEADVKKQKKWGKPPEDGDMSLITALERIRVCRNSCFAHATSATVEDTEFKKIWNQVEKSLQRIEENLDPAVASICYLDQMKKLEENPILDPKTKPLLQQLAEKEKQLMESHKMSAETDRLLGELIGIREKYKKNIPDFKSQLSVHSYRIKDANIGQTEHYLRECKMENKFYVKTNVFYETEKFLKKYNCVIIVGKPGSGKTGIAKQLMFKYSDEFVVRILDSPSEFQLIDPTMKSLIFIDNIFDCTDDTLKAWWKRFDKIEDFVCSKCVNQNVFKNDNAVEETEGEVPEFITYVVITTRPHLLEAAKERMDKTHSLLEKYALDIDSENFSLSAREKRDILEAKLRYASQEQNIKEENFSKEDWTSIFQSCPPFGFPLCAHLFACDERYRKDGTKFFSNPHQYMLDGLKEMLKMQYSRRKEALFILMLVCDIKDRSLEYDNEGECWKVLTDLGLTDLKELSLEKNKDVKDLPQAATELEEKYLRKCSKQGYKFIHPSVREAVETYFIEKYTQKAIEILPMRVLSSKMFSECSSDEYAPLMNLHSTKERLAKRLILEINEGNICEVCKFPGIKNKNFSGVFLSEITRNAETVKNVMSIKDNCGFPFMYWFTLCAHLDTVLRLLRNETVEKVLTESELLMQYGYSLIASCISEEKIEITDFILEKYSGKDIQNFYGDENRSSGVQFNQSYVYPLSEALRTRNEKAIQLLLKKKACFPSSTWKGWPFLHACYNEPTICCSEFLEAVLSFDRNESVFESNEEKDVLKYDQIRATEETFLESIVSKIEKSIRLNKESCKMILFYLIQISNLEISDGIIHAFCSIPEIKQRSEVERINPLNFVDDNGNSILHLLLNYQRNQPTMGANYDDIAQPEDDIVEGDKDENLPMLPEEVTDDYQLDIVFARMEEKSVHLRTIRRFYKKGADLNMKNKMGETPLMIEISKFCPSIDVVKSLLHYQANPNVQDNCGRSCLHKLLLQNYKKNIPIEKFLALLIKSGADLNMVDKFGNSPILTELKRQRPRSGILNQLIDAQIDMRIADSNGKTALSVALAASYETDIMKKEIVKILLKSKSVDALSRDKTGISAFRFALGNPNIEEDILIQIALHDSCRFPLHECIKENVEETIKIQGITHLLSTGNDKLQISAKDPEDQTLLITAAQACPHMHRLLEFLLSKDVPINAKDSSGKSALFYMMESDVEFSARETSFNLLLAKRPSVNDEIGNIESHSPLLKAMQSMVCRSFLFDPLEFPSEAVANKVAIAESPKKHISRIGLFPDRMSDLKIEIVQKMLDICTADLNFSVDEKERTYLHYCASSRLADKQTLAICKRLVELGVDVDQKDKDGLTCIDMAFKFYEKKFDTLVFLIEKSTNVQGLDIDKLLEYLADNTDLYEKLVQYLTESMFELNKPKRNLFHYLALIGYYAKDQAKAEREAVFDKLQKYFPAHEKNEDGHIPLHTAIESNTSVSCIRSFVRISTSYLDERDLEGNTALHLVLKSNREDVDVLTIVKKMLKFKVDINAQNDLGRTPLMIAVRCEKDRTNTIKELLNHKERLNLLLLDRTRFSVLHHCIDTSKDDFTAHCILSIFLDSGLSLPIKAKTIKGYTALNYAAKYARFSRILCIIKMLQTKGCTIETVDEKGQSPLYNSAINLKGVNPLIVLERLLRAYIFLIHGDSDMETNNGDKVSSVCEKFEYGSLKELIDIEDIDGIDSDAAYDIIKRVWITVSSGHFPRNHYEHIFGFKDEKIKSLILDSLPFLSHRRLDNLKNEEPLVDDTCLSSVPDLERDPVSAMME